MNFPVPFYSNTEDNTHCFQAALRMVLKHFLPSKEYSWRELDRMTAKVEGLWTWPLAGTLKLQRMGFDVVLIEEFDYERFSKEGGDYLYEFWGEEVAKAQIEHSEIRQEQNLSKEFVKKIRIEKRLPFISDIIKLMNNGFLVICNVNSRKLNQLTGYSGHFVVIKGYSDSELTIHDPGLPPLRDRSVAKETFEQAWQYPDATSKNVMAFNYSP